MRQVCDFVVTWELLKKILTSETHMHNLPADGKVMHVFVDEKKMCLRVRIEHESLMRIPEGGFVYEQSPEITEEE